MNRIPSAVRVKAFRHLEELQAKGVERVQIVRLISETYGIPSGTVYCWILGSSSPFRKRRIRFCKELFYVLGALLGDGYVYSWKTDRHIVGVVGEKEFIDKYAQKLSVCIGRKVKGYINRSRHVWFVVVGNAELFFLFKEIRRDLEKLKLLMADGDFRANSLEFIGGFFDAEGCIKIIKEKVRKTPKICPDLCNTNYSYLELVRILLKEHLDIDAKYSIQKAYMSKDGSPRKESYHLRIYKKDFVRRFLESIPTTKLKPEKASFVENWLNLKKSTQPISLT